jgi:hypothetical protein
MPASLFRSPIIHQVGEVQRDFGQRDFGQCDLESSRRADKTCSCLDAEVFA